MALFKYTRNALTNDRATRIVVPNLTFLLGNALTNLASTAINNSDPTEKRIGGFFSKKEDAPVRNTVADTIRFLSNTFSVGLGVTEIESINEYVMPMSKGIGSDGEVIHLLGARNEIIKLSFTTDEYGGSLGILFKNLLQKIMNDAILVFLVDDMYTAVPCLIRNFKIKKVAEYQNVIMGDMELVAVTRESKIFEEPLSKAGGKLRSAVGKLKQSIATGFTTSTVSSGGAAQGSTLQRLGNLAVNIAFRGGR